MPDDGTRGGGRPAKDALFEALTVVARALSSGRRAEIVELLAQGPRSVEQIADDIDQSVANASHHLRTLARAGLVRTRRDGTRIIYRLADPDVFRLWQTMRTVASRQVEEIEDLAHAYIGPVEGLEAVPRAELRNLLQDDEVVVIDVRPSVEHRAGHIPGAISIPVDELDQRLDQLPVDVPVVAYCRGPYCAYADEAVRRLRARGRDARRLQDGFPDWEQAGLPTARPDADVSDHGRT